MLCACFLCKHVRLSCVFYNKLTYLPTLREVIVVKIVHIIQGILQGTLRGRSKYASNKAKKEDGSNLKNR